MKYRSTRGHPSRPSFCEILLEGLAPDGGLYLPEIYPQIDATTLQHWRSLTHADLAFEILSLFISDIPVDDLRRICHATYRPDIFAFQRAPDLHQATEITPLRWLEPRRLALLELSNGPTLAFKDQAMQLLGHLFEYVLKKAGRTLNILGATSGDTGSAAEYAMRGKAGVRVFMLSPHGKMSAFQRAQMYSLNEDNIFNIAVTGMFDDAQDVVKAVSADASFKARHAIGAVNSINWARIAAQIIYYFKGYFAATQNNDEQVAFCVPSGNFGNVCAGHIARQMGLPIARLIVATNENDVLDEFFRTGRYRPRHAAQTVVTSSPSMDISKASNFERFVFDVVRGDSARLNSLWQQLQHDGDIDFAAEGLFDSVHEAFAFTSGSSCHMARLSAIRRVFSQSQLMIDPHTADGLNVAWQVLEDLPRQIPLVVLETAQPAKFSDTLYEALGEVPELPSALAGIEQLSQKVTVLPADADAIKTFIAAHSGA